MPTYARADLVIERGEGMYLYTSDNRRLIDFAAGVAVVSLGHCHPTLVAALQRQAATLWHCSNLYRIPGQERLAARLVEASFADSVFFSNSGLEAMEAGLKLVRRYHDETGHPERWRVVVCSDAFHGRSLATIAAGGQPKHLKGFDPVVPGFDRVAYGNLNETRVAIGPETAAILVEPIQGEGGLRVPPPGYLGALRAIADEFGLLLFLDEVQTGMGRTGKLFAHEWDGVRPDIVAVAKGLGGGFPVGATLAVERVAKVMTAGSHGSTFGGNPLAMAAANATLDVMLADGFFERVRTLGTSLKREIEALGRRHPRVVAEVRGLGLMLGFKTTLENSSVAQALQDAGLLTVLAGDNVVRLVPPLIVEESHVREAMAIMDRVFAALVEKPVPAKAGSGSA
ncbi:MAG: aspartate aminotransferase family protein [Rhodospirillales bacterium]|nr:aspartate aminotransferase family protein [Rhodospirillales bacterium]MSP80094.1 aspartate aminotransferase family protein [Rhodospirillales bacterium]